MKKIFFILPLAALTFSSCKKIRVEFRLPDTKTEALICTTMGPAYPALVITSAE